MNGNSDKCPCTESNKEYGEINIIDLFVFTSNYNRLLTYYVNELLFKIVFLKRMVLM